jgi:hypothetical protein
MSSRKEKLTLAKLLLLMAAVIWVPQLLKPLAGIPDSPDPAEQQTPTEPPLEAELAAPAMPLDVRPISVDTPRETADEAVVEDSAERGDFFELDRVLPAPAGLELIATLVSPSGKSAIIDGQVYAEGELISFGDVPFRLRSIFPGRVILERDGGMFELKEKRNFTDYFKQMTP